jgi:hypothetical protein
MIGSVRMDYSPTGLDCLALLVISPVAYDVVRVQILLIILTIDT